jgi:biopolymer transport protein TolQ
MMASVYSAPFVFHTLAETGPNLFTYFSDSNLAGKVIVLLLVVFSLLAWTVMIGKYIDLSRLRQANLLFERRLRQEPSLAHALAGGRTPNGPYAILTKDALDAASRYTPAPGRDENTALRISHVENALNRGVARQCIVYESKMVLLGSIVSGAPFMGLLGTVWGVMDAFGSITLQSSASLQNLAPGVSGALLTTVAGLLVAIPSVFGYNFLLTQMKIMVTELENYASSVADRLETEILSGMPGPAQTVDLRERPSTQRPDRPLPPLRDYDDDED